MALLCRCQGIVAVVEDDVKQDYIEAAMVSSRATDVWLGLKLGTTDVWYRQGMCNPSCVLTAILFTRRADTCMYMYMYI